MKLRLGTDKEYVNPLWVLLAGMIAIGFISENAFQAIKTFGIISLGLLIISFVMGLGTLLKRKD